MRTLHVIAATLALATLPALAADEHPGRAVYASSCAACHDNPQQTRSTPVENLRAMRYQTIYYALTEGKMKPQGAQLSKTQQLAVIDWLVGREPVSDAWIAAMQCAPERRKVDLARPATVAGFGYDARHHRRLTREQAGLATADFARLELAWALAIPKATTMRAQPAIWGTTMFVPVPDAGRLIALDIANDAPGHRPCIKWSYDNGAPLRTGASLGELPGSKRKVVVYSDAAVTVHVLDALTGEQIWERRAAVGALSNLTATPVMHGSRVYVPLSASEINIGGNDAHECCKSHGAVMALDARTGRHLWTTHTMEEATPQYDRGDGRMLWGPSGAPIWNTPLIDAARGVLYVGTGEATSRPAAPTTDAILAIDLADGRIRWKFQATPDDIFLTTCVSRPKNLNCPREGRLLDWDFGAAPLLVKRADGSDLLIAGQKSGTVWALDPQRRGALVWSRDVGQRTSDPKASNKGSAIGGIHWGLAYDGERVFAPVNALPGPDGRDPNQIPGLYALRVETGELVWSYENVANCSGERPQHVKNCASWIGMTAAPSVIDGAVIQGSADGFLRAFEAASGKLLFEFDTARAYDGVNGVAGQGGALDNVSIVAANGYLFVNSGYGLMGGQAPGNVLLAFRRAADPASAPAR